jgi:hypothetical protein
LIAAVIFASCGARDKEPRDEAPGGKAATDRSLTRIKKLTASDNSKSVSFGGSMAIYGDTAIVTANEEKIGGNDDQGSAYVFERNQGGVDNWGQVKKLIASDGSMNDYFGASAAINGDTAIIGANGDEIRNNREQGSAYIFERNKGGANNWGQAKKLIASDGGEIDRFGGSVAIDGDTAIVGAPDINFQRGAVYIFDRNKGGSNNWGQAKKLTASDAHDDSYFGESVAIYGDTAIVGANYMTGANLALGAVYVFERNKGGANNWGRVKKLAASDGNGGDEFGNSVAIYGNVAIVGEHNRFIGSNFYQGVAYIFERNQGRANNWGQVKKLIASDGVKGAHFGESVAIYADMAIVGANGATYIFERNHGGTSNWGEVKNLTSSDGAEGDLLGAPVGIYGDTAIVSGGKANVGSAIQRGSVCIFLPKHLRR